MTLPVLFGNSHAERMGEMDDYVTFVEGGLRLFEATKSEIFNDMMDFLSRAVPLEISTTVILMFGSDEIQHALKLSWGRPKIAACRLTSYLKEVCVSLRAAHPALTIKVVDMWHRPNSSDDWKQCQILVNRMLGTRLPTGTNIARASNLSANRHVSDDGVHLNIYWMDEVWQAL